MALAAVVDSVALSPVPMSGRWRVAVYLGSSVVRCLKLMRTVVERGGMVKAMPPGTYHHEITFPAESVMRMEEEST